ncbi:MAG TPA: DUF1223 domain-containing protein, partial [Caulobacteraceae bacterium]|nr:DUF1223 domain-containing protein [Caulobacteraceae bacterium]
MRRAALLLFFCLVSAAPGLAQARPPKTPVVVELFTAQGCATCGKANALVASLADRPGVVALTWSVDYWDYTGWKDTFAKPEFGDRQRAYERRFGLRDVYTPQVVVGGSAEGTGAKRATVEALIQKWRRPLHPPTIRIARGRVSVGAARAPGSADVWLIRYDPRE